MDDELLQKLINKAEETISKEAAIQVEHKSQVQNKIMDERMNIFLSISFLIFAIVFLRKGKVKKIIFLFCILNLYFSSVSYLGLKFQSIIPALVFNLVLLILLIFYLKNRGRKKNYER